MVRRSLLRRSGLRLLGLGLLAYACHSASDGPQDASTGPERVTIGAVRWYVDYDAALDVARREDLPLWVHFGENPG